jgi:fatty-acyl-CoA synthase
MLSTMQDGTLSLARLLEHGATLHSGAEVATWTGSEFRRMNFAQLGAQAARLANALRGLGVADADRVGTFMWNNNEHMTAYAAVPAMGAVLHTLNLRLFPDQLTYIVNHGQDKVVLVDASVLPLFAKQLPNLKSVEHVVVVNGDPGALQPPPGLTVHGYDELVSAHSDEFAWPTIDEHSAAALCYTSGTTGDPKGVMYSHRSMYLHSMQVCMTDSLRLSQGDKTLAIVPMFHVLSWGLPHASLMVGASLLMPDRFLQPPSIAAMLAAEKPNFAAAVPTIWQGLLQHLADNPQDISHLAEVVVGGSACPPAMMQTYWREHKVRILHAWGMTETSPLGSVARPPRGVSAETEWAYRYTQGRFPASVEARLVGDEGKVLPWDDVSVGELEVRGPWIAGAYYSAEGPTTDESKFRDGWLRTGDVGRISPEGFLALTDRSKDVIKSGGEWISSVDLENAVMGHPAVAEAAVIGVPDEKWQERPLVAVVLRAGQSVTAAELHEFLTPRVARWQLPERWTFIDEVPKTSVGKFDKKRLRARYAGGELDVVSC